MKAVWQLFLDDERYQFDHWDDKWYPNMITARSSKEAIALIKENGLPSFMSLDHDLGGEDTTMVFLKEMINLFPSGPVPNWHVHSANPVGKENINSFLESWRKSLED